MGNFYHGDEGKISQMEEMGNDACVLIGYHDKVCLSNLCQIIHIMNNLFHHLTLIFHLQEVPYQKNESVNMIRWNPQQLQNKSVTWNLFPPTEDYIIEFIPYQLPVTKCSSKLI